MKNIFLLLVMAIAFLNPANAGETIKLSAPISIWIQEQGDTLTGPVIDIVEDVFGELDITVSTEKLPWARAIERMKSGELDIIPVIFYTEERSQFMEFSVPYMAVPTVVFVPSGKTFSFDSLEDLKGRSGVIVRGDSISKEFEEFETQLNLTEVSNYGQILKMLASNRAEYAVVAKYGFMVELQRLEFERKVEMLPRPVASRNLHVALSKKSKYVNHLSRVNRKIEQFIADGTIERMGIDTMNKAADK